jgi:hypothetical protein
MDDQPVEESRVIPPSEDIQIYDISPAALRYYKNNVHRGKKSNDEIIQRKLTGLIMCSSTKKKIEPQKFIYKFSGFNIVVNEEKKLIEWLYWNKESHLGPRTSKEERERLHKIYKTLMLSDSGNSFRR